MNAIANSVLIGERADAHLPEVKRHLPVFIPNDSPWVEKDKYADDEADLALPRSRRRGDAYAAMARILRRK
jgi:hypothetical protein